jgi:hypothetical protein
VEFILIILAVMLAVFLGWLLKSSFNVQPWVAEPVDETANQAPMNANAKVVALATLLAVVTSFFALIMSAYGLRMDYGDWVPLNEPQLLWLNTGMLFLASLVLQWTRNGTVSGQVSRLKPGLIVTGLLTFAFPWGHVRLGTRHAAGRERRTSGLRSRERGAVHGLLAFPVDRLAGDVRLAVVDLTHEESHLCLK